MEAESARERTLLSRPPAVVLDLPGRARVSFRTLTLRDIDSLIARRDLPPIEFAVETLAGQAENLPDIASALRELPRPTLLRLVRSWAAHPDTFKAAPSQIRSFSDFKLIAESKVEELERSFRNLSQQIVDQFSPVVTETQKLFGAVSKIDRQLTATLTRTMKKLVASFDSVASKLEDNARELGKSGWTMPMWAPIEVLADLVQFTDQQRDSIFLREYSLRQKEREKQLFSGLLDTPALLHWRPLLAECIDVYRKRKYRAAVPSLLTVVEGAVVSTTNLSSRKPGPKGVAAQGVRTRDPGVIRTAWVSVEAFVGEVFCDRNFSGPRPSLINRHWICHGRDVPEWDRTDCLRLFQALDTIAQVIGSRPRAANPADRADGNRKQRGSRRSSA